MGPGKYDELCGRVRQATQARGAMIIIIEGNRGSGFSAHLIEETSELEVEKKVVQILRDILEQIEEDIAENLQADRIQEDAR